MLKDMIGRRKSCRSYTNNPVAESLLEQIRAFVMRPLYSEIKVHWQIVPRNQIRTLCPWSTPQLIAFYSEEKEGWLENTGFMLQQMDLYLQSLGLGACWLGLGKMKAQVAPPVEGMRFVILLAFGEPKGEALRRDVSEFNRKPPEQIADVADPRLEPARLAPSAVNSQPWYFVHEGELRHVYRIHNARLEYMNKIDMGIALAHLYVAGEETFRFFASEHPEIPNGSYVGSVTL